MEQYIAQGGVQIGEPQSPPTGSINTTLALLSGKAVLSDLQKNKEEKNAVLDKQNADRLRAEAIALEEAKLKANSNYAGGKNNVVTGNPFDDEPVPPVPPSAPPAPHVPYQEALPVAVPVNQHANIPDATTSNRPLSVSLNSTVRYKVIALYDLEATESDELSFAVDDIIEILDDTDEGWWFGRNMKTAKTGLFPINYTRKL